MYQILSQAMKGDTLRVVLDRTPSRQSSPSEAALVLGVSERPYRRLSGPADVSIMPAQIARMGATVSDIVNLAALAAHDALR